MLASCKTLAYTLPARTRKGAQRWLALAATGDVGHQQGGCVTGSDKQTNSRSAHNGRPPPLAPPRGRRKREHPRPRRGQGPARAVPHRVLLLRRGRRARAGRERLPRRRPRRPARRLRDAARGVGVRRAAGARGVPGGRGLHPGLDRGREGRRRRLRDGPERPEQVGGHADAETRREGGRGGFIFSRLRALRARRI